MKYCANKEIDRLVRNQIKEGWHFRWGGKHGRLRSPDGKTTLSVPCTPSDRRAFINFLCDVRRTVKNSNATGTA